MELNKHHDIEHPPSHDHHHQQQQQQQHQQKHLSRIILSFTLLFLGAGGPFLLRVYFIHGGSRKWFSSWLQMGGWPVLLLPLSFSYLRQYKQTKKVSFCMSPKLTLACSLLGLFLGLDSYLFTFSSAYLPVSTASILFSSQLAFTAFFSFFIVRQRFTACLVNAIVLLTMGSVALGLRAGGDRPDGESNSEYWMGFVMTVGAAALCGLVTPLIQLVYEKSKQKMSFDLLLEVSLVIAFFGAGFCLVGMLINNDFQAIPKEAREFGLGETKYYIVIVCDAILWQVLALILLDEKFSELKGLALVLTIWGFTSYLYGEYQQTKKINKMKESVALELPVP
ncbi:purine permease 3-like isoform X2 [Dioscorea cayenensis subsp. rotundata]|uniref:Probable purine permease n=1 Tax=Dioscorea cayennensis subsp. rotundata TaxID=55577 RepID=A0AB40D055_DIOCR|nr:purine permease 3-like isoform X2 [Dioscorea cayenensis subsp. rotundata]